MRAWISALHWPATFMVVTITLPRRKMSSTSWTLDGLCFSVTTTGGWMFSGTQPHSISLPSVMNLLTVWSRKAALGTTIISRCSCAQIRSDSIVSVLPVPVGMTMVAGSSLTLQCASAACKAPIWGRRSPLMGGKLSRSSWRNVNCPVQLSTIRRQRASLSRISSSAGDTGLGRYQYALPSSASRNRSSVYSTPGITNTESLGTGAFVVLGEIKKMPPSPSSAR